MRSTRRRNSFLRRIVLGLTVALLVVPSAAQAQWHVPKGVHGHANNRGVGSYTEYVPFVTDFPKYELNTAKVVGIGGPRMHVIGTSEPSVSSTRIVSSRGFDWGDAAIGATLALGLALLAGSAVRVSRQFGKPQTA
jgi:hypothetical protein